MDTYGLTSTELVEKRLNPRFPLIKKFRTAFPGGMNQVLTLTNDTCVHGPRPASDAYIVWRLTSKRHFSRVSSIPALDIPWEQKQHMAVFRGKLTGTKRDGFRPSVKGMTDEEKCLWMHRCKLVYQNHNSTLVDARLTPPLPPRSVSETVGEVPVLGDKLSFEQLLQYKAIIMLEGNDVSSGFKWAMYSNSVVMTQIPTKS